MFPFLGFFHSLLLYMRFTEVVAWTIVFNYMAIPQFVYLVMDAGLFPAFGYYK